MGSANTNPRRGDAPIARNPIVGAAMRRPPDMNHGFRLGGRRIGAPTDFAAKRLGESSRVPTINTLHKKRDHPIG